MTSEEFEKVWPELGYNRTQNQGYLVTFPDLGIKIKRTAYGRNGKGRHGLFCFSDEYQVETWKNGSSSTFHVKRSHGGVPYEIKVVKQGVRDGPSGTLISCNIKKNNRPEEFIRELLGSKFITDPDFTIYLNGHKINLLDLHDVESFEYEVPGEKEKVTILRIDSKKIGRLSRHHGVAWWVNKRLVGEHSWKGFEGAYLDGRSSEAKRYTFIIEADLLADEVKPDWTGFKETDRAKRVVEDVNVHILNSIQTLMQGARKETKKTILREHMQTLRALSPLSKQHLGQFVDQIQMKCPTMSLRDLSNTVDVLANMELTSTGYDLLQKLAHLSPDDLEGLNKILDDWSIADAKKVLDELHWRLDIIKNIGAIMDRSGADELHELQPLFERGLWIFGPEYETKEFTSNKTLSTVIAKFFGKKGIKIENPAKRPDFVVLPDSSISVYSSDAYDVTSGEVCGIQKILIIELKKGGSTVGVSERRQAEDYATDLMTSGQIRDSTDIIAD